MRFSDRTAIVSGAASGMGLLASQTLAAEGAKVVLTDVNEEAVVAAAAEIRQNGGEAAGYRVDVRDYEQVQGAVAFALEQYGTVDILLNCAGGAAGRMLGRPGRFHDMDIDVIEWGLEVNLKGAVFFSHAAIKPMIQNKRGVIVTMGSVTGLVGSPSGAEYAASKSGMLGFTKSLALDGAEYGVRAVCVSPGPVLTRADMAKLKTPVGRAAEPIEVVKLMLYLCSDEAAFITGSNHVIDGGRCCGGFS